MKHTTIVGLAVATTVLAAIVFGAAQKTMPGNFQITVKQSGGTGLLAKECANRSYINSTADYIIDGIVENVESKRGNNNAIFTYTNLSIKNYTKGVPFKIVPANLQIMTPGGCVGEICQEAEDQPIFHKGKAARIYFKSYSGEFSMVCGIGGVEEIIPSP